jgi:hypothetical protein
MVPIVSALESLSKAIDNEVRESKKVYVHCHQGIYSPYRRSSLSCLQRDEDRRCCETGKRSQEYSSARSGELAEAYACPKGVRDQGPNKPQTRETINLDSQGNRQRPGR